MNSIMMSHNSNDLTTNESNNDMFLNDESIRLDASMASQFDPEDAETTEELVHLYRQVWQKKVSPLSYQEEDTTVEKSFVRRTRANTEDTFTDDEEDDDDCGFDEEHATPVPSSKKKKKSLWGELTTSMPSSSLDLSTSSLVHQYLEENNKESQSTLYKAMASKIMIPTVTYMGRKLHADGAGSTASPQTTTSTTSRLSLQHKPEPRSSFVARMGLSWSSGSSCSVSSSSSLINEEAEEDAKDYLSNLSDSDFSQLKATLRAQGALTGLCTQQLMYTTATTAAALVKTPSPKRRRRSSSQHKWGQLPFCPSLVSATADSSDDDEEDDDMPDHFVISQERED
ncbi:expressed unknown protein [Seminavis robusta]|uniref:Uncharacterized protein n=1 Tax=Seminavis robusta TaxID=568900 RepID=A0A9N8EUA7_9STRA|nr:expressed unknown protein [Seminavis robusta]|eukprot:Sro1706_g292500.1 n/a (341) ;mRNA; r:5480-6502